MQYNVIYDTKMKPCHISGFAGNYLNNTWQGQNKSSSHLPDHLA